MKNQKHDHVKGLDGDIHYIHVLFTLLLALFFQPARSVTLSNAPCPADAFMYNVWYAQMKFLIQWQGVRQGICICWARLEDNKMRQVEKAHSRFHPCPSSACSSGACVRGRSRGKDYQYQTKGAARPLCCAAQPDVEFVPLPNGVVTGGVGNELAVEMEASVSAGSESAGTEKEDACTTPVGATAGDTAPPPAATAATWAADATTGLTSSGLTATLVVWDRRRRPRAAGVSGWQPTEERVGRGAWLVMGFCFYPFLSSSLPLSLPALTRQAGHDVALGEQRDGFTARVTARVHDGLGVQRVLHEEVEAADQGQLSVDGHLQAGHKLAGGGDGDGGAARRARADGALHHVEHGAGDGIDVAHNVAGGGGRGGRRGTGGEGGA